MSTRRIRTLCFILMIGLWTLASQTVWSAPDANATAQAKARPNVLFIAVDDLNHWVGHLGRNSQTITPNIDRLAKMGVTFTRAYCAAPVCDASRAALLSGKRPGVTGVYDNRNPYNGVIPPDESVVMRFKNAGYETLGMGKLWHGGLVFKHQQSGGSAPQCGRCGLGASGTAGATTDAGRFT